LISQGLWGQRFWYMFKRVIGREYLEFDEFALGLSK